MLYSNRYFEASANHKINHHRWVTVRNPMNESVLLQACDHCGVVKSQNTVIKSCSAEPDQFILSELNKR